MVNRHALLVLIITMISISLVGQVNATWYSNDNQTTPEVRIDAPAYVTMNVPFFIQAHTYNASGPLINCTDDGGIPVNPKIFIKDDHDNSFIVNGLGMNSIDTGIYIFNASVPKQSTYNIYSTCVMNHVPYTSNPQVITSMGVPMDLSAPAFNLNPCRHLKLGYYNKHLVFDKQMGCYDPDEV